MDSTSTMNMNPSMTMSSAMASSTASGGMGGMGGMSMGGSNACKISMLWNWYTIDACFLSTSWHITSSGMFAGSCIGVICLVISLEFLRRLQREYDAYLRRSDRRAISAAVAAAAARSNSETPESEQSSDVEIGKQPRAAGRLLQAGEPVMHQTSQMTLIGRQTVRAVIHMFQFAVAYFIMLLAMYYNGYILICIFIGAGLGSFIFSWDQLLQNTEARQQPADVTGCCG